MGEKNEMTSIMGRLQIDGVESFPLEDLSAIIGVARDQFIRTRGSKISCCVKYDKTGQVKCDQTDWLSKSDFEKHCRKCQSEIANFLGVEQKCLK